MNLRKDHIEEDTLSCSLPRLVHRISVGCRREEVASFSLRSGVRLVRRGGGSAELGSLVVHLCCPFES